MAQFVLDEKVLEKVVSRQLWLTNTLIRTPISINRLAHLLLLSGSSPDFDVPNGGTMSHTSFHGTMVEIVNWGCAAYAQAHTDVHEVSLNANRIPSSTQDIVNIILEDCHEHAFEAMEDLATTVEKCENLILGAMKKFADVIRLVQDVGEYLIEAHATAPPDIAVVLKKAVAELSTGKDLWREINKFFFAFSAMIQIDMKRHFGTFKNAVYKKWDIKYIPALANRLRLIALQIHFIAETYMRASDEHLEPRVRTITNLILVTPDASTFEELERQCEEDKKAISGIVNEHMEPLSSEIQERMDTSW